MKDTKFGPKFETDVFHEVKIENVTQFDSIDGVIYQIVGVDSEGNSVMETLPYPNLPSSLPTMFEASLEPLDIFKRREPRQTTFEFYSGDWEGNLRVTERDEWRDENGELICSNPRPSFLVKTGIAGNIRAMIEDSKKMKDSKDWVSIDWETKNLRPICDGRPRGKKGKRK